MLADQTRARYVSIMGRVEACNANSTTNNTFFFCRRLSILLSLSSSYSTSRRRGGDWLLGVDSAGASSPPVAVSALEMGRGCGVDGRGNPIILGLASLRLVSFVLVLPMRSLVSLHGDVDEGDGGGGFFCITGWRYVVHLSEK